MHIYIDFFFFFLSWLRLKWSWWPEIKLQMNTKVTRCLQNQPYKIICQWQFVLLPPSGLKIITATAEVPKFVFTLVLFHCAGPCTKTNSLNACNLVNLFLIVILNPISVTHITQPSWRLQWEQLISPKLNFGQIYIIYNITRFLSLLSLLCFFFFFFFISLWLNAQCSRELVSPP